MSLIDTWIRKLRPFSWLLGTATIAGCVFLALLLWHDRPDRSSDQHAKRSTPQVTAEPEKAVEPPAPVASQTPDRITFDFSRPKEELDKIIADKSVDLRKRWDLAERAEVYYQRQGRRYEATDLAGKAALLLVDLEGSHSGQLFLIRRIRRSFWNPAAVEANLAFATNAIAISPKGTLTAESWLKQAEILQTYFLLDGSSTEAIEECYRGAIEAAPDSKWALKATLLLSRILRSQERVSEAKEACDLSLKNSAASTTRAYANLMFELGSVYEASEDFGRAHKWYLQMLTRYRNTSIERIVLAKLAYLESLRGES